MTTSPKTRKAVAQVGPDARLTFRANVTVTRRDLTGKIIEEIKIKNLLVATGRGLMVEQLGGTANAAPTHMAMGTSNTPVTDADTTLAAEYYRDLITRRRAFTSRIQYQLFLDTTQGNGVTYSEAGLFNVRNGSSIMFARVLFTGIPKDNSSTLTLSWDISLASS